MVPNHEMRVWFEKFQESYNIPDSFLKENADTINSIKRDLAETNRILLRQIESLNEKLEEVIKSGITQRDEALHNAKQFVYEEFFERFGVRFDTVEWVEPAQNILDLKYETRRGNDEALAQRIKETPHMHRTAVVTKKKPLTTDEYEKDE
jgi:hypothetical protein